MGRRRTGDRRLHRGPSLTDFAAGTVVVTPAGFWHHLRPRDPAGSAVLRGLSDGVAATLVIEAGKLRPPANDSRVPLAAVVELVRRAIPELSNEAMVKGVAGVVRYAAERVTAHRVAVEALTGSAPADDRAVPVEVKEYLIFLALLPFLCSPNLTGTARMVAAAGATLAAHLRRGPCCRWRLTTDGSARSPWCARSCIWRYRRRSPPIAARRAWRCWPSSPTRACSPPALGCAS